MRPAAPATAPAQDTTTNTNPTGSDYTPGNLLLGLDTSDSVGTYLIASNGMTLYTYNKDTTGVSNCTGGCASAWPPYTVTDISVLGNLEAGVTGTAGTITRADGTMQVTYNGMPLYFFESDAVSGDTTGNGVNGFTIAKP